jgi:tetratricopeptide (TPR) repeat protein
VAASPASFKTHKGLAGAVYEAHPTEENLDVAIGLLETGRRVLERRPLELPRREATLYVHLGIYLRQKADLLWGRGAEGEAKGYFRRAVAVLEKAREVDRFNVSNRLRALRARGESPSDYGDESIYATLGYCQLRLEAWADVAEAGAMLQRISPGNAFGYTLAGVAAAKRGQAEVAAVQFAANLVLKPDDGDARANLTHCFESLGVVPNPVALDGPRLHLSIADPRAEAHLATAIRLLITNLERAGREPEAQRIREIALQQFKLRPELLQSDAAPKP